MAKNYFGKYHQWKCPPLNGEGKEWGKQGGPAGCSTPSPHQAPCLLGVPCLLVGLLSEGQAAVSPLGRTRAPRPVQVGAQRFQLRPWISEVVQSYGFSLILHTIWVQAAFLIFAIASVRRKGKILEVKSIPQSTNTSISVSYNKTSGAREAAATIGFWRCYIWNSAINPCIFSTHFTQTSVLHLQCHSVFVLLSLSNYRIQVIV